LNGGRTVAIYRLCTRLPSFSISLSPKYDNVCSVIASPNVSVFVAVANKRTSEVVPMSAGLFNDAMLEFMGTLYLDVPYIFD
jgi:hypothetical protein